jgi:hypothetical protein
VIDTRLLYIAVVTLLLILVIDGSTPRGTRESGVQTGDLEGTREISTRHGRAFLALVVSPRDGVTGPHYHEH